MTHQIVAPLKNGYEAILTPEAIAFLVALETRFGSRRLELLAKRDVRRLELEAGALPDFLESTRAIRESDWTVAPIPAALEDRRVEITGPVERKMVINALNCGAPTFMADFEDSNSPTWTNAIDGQINLRDAVAGTIGFTSPEGKVYKLNEKPAVLIVRTVGGT